ncbi:MAG TPA: peptidoglycan DD-metalloendopeptidase family protein [Symbiobacteriaceae bacterium]|nr:peptidoglycan DD-metalloendopeptidase family protein [Symbiobacteriaceae bacterium]
MSGEELLKKLREEFGRFRESRLYLQIIAAVGLVLVAALVSVGPAGPVAKVRQGLAWTVTHDYDFAGRWAGANKWAAGRGGWRPAIVGLWNEQTARVRKLLPSKVPAKVEEPAPVKPADPAPPVVETPAETTVLPVNGKVLYGYGWLPKGQEPHAGLDFAAPVGAPVVAIADGTVLRVGTDPAIGGLVEVDHGFAVALYGQVGSIKPKAGEKVKQGQTLATVAKPTGKEGEDGAHLHVEIRATKGGKPVDPAPFLPLGQGGDGN